MTIRALEDAGAVVVPVRYDDDLLSPDQERFEAGIRRELTGALAFYRPDRVTIVGKSRGTHALALVCNEDFLADHQYHDADRHREVLGETVEISGADHRLDVADDIFATLDAWAEHGRRHRALQ